MSWSRSQSRSLSGAMPPAGCTTPGRSGQVGRRVFLTKMMSIPDPCVLVTEGRARACRENAWASCIRYAEDRIVFPQNP